MSPGPPVPEAGHSLHDGACGAAALDHRRQAGGRAVLRRLDAHRARRPAVRLRDRPGEAGNPGGRTHHAHRARSLRGLPQGPAGTGQGARSRHRRRGHDHGAVPRPFLRPPARTCARRSSTRCTTCCCWPTRAARRVPGGGRCGAPTSPRAPTGIRRATNTLRMWWLSIYLAYITGSSFVNDEESLLRNYHERLYSLGDRFPRRRQEILREFHRFVRSHPRRGQPRVKQALLTGRFACEPGGRPRRQPAAGHSAHGVALLRREHAGVAARHAGVRPALPGRVLSPGSGCTRWSRARSGYGAGTPALRTASWS